MRTDFKKLIFDMVRLSIIAIVVGYFGRGLLKNDWQLERAIQIGLILGISYPLFKVIMMKYGPKVNK